MNHSPNRTQTGRISQRYSLFYHPDWSLSPLRTEDDGNKNKILMPARSSLELFIEPPNLWNQTNSNEALCAFVLRSRIVDSRTIPPRPWFPPVLASSSSLCWLWFLFHLHQFPVWVNAFARTIRVGVGLLLEASNVLKSKKIVWKHAAARWHAMRNLASAHASLAVRGATENAEHYARKLKMPVFLNASLLSSLVRRMSSTLALLPISENNCRNRCFDRSIWA